MLKTILIRMHNHLMTDFNKQTAAVFRHAEQEDRINQEPREAGRHQDQKGEEISTLGDIPWHHG